VVATLALVVIVRFIKDNN